jgi:deoxyribodipyrimidine photo-lyase
MPSRPPSLESAALVWFRRDLRLDDHAALYHALKSHARVYCVFVFDTDILDALPSRADRRVEFIHACVLELAAALRELGGGLVVLHGRARDAVPKLAAQLKVDAVYANHDYEPAAISRDETVAAELAVRGAAFQTFKDQVVFEREEVMTLGDTPYSVFTPYKNAWLKKLDAFYLKPYPVRSYIKSLAPPPLTTDVPTLATMGFETTNFASLNIPAGMSGAAKLLKDFRARMDEYQERRDFPAIKGPSYLSVHLRFGTVSIRALAAEAHARASRGAQVWLSELIWRDFYFMILSHHPHVVGHSFKREFEGVVFDNDAQKFAAWCEGRTGYPLVDAAMRQINATGYMHNRLRMIAASFLVKDLHVDWRWGEKYFADNLNDFDLAANNGGWQWAASTGCDAQPYFRIFNPVTQSERFDAEGKFIRKYVPELAKVQGKFIHAPWTLGPIEQEAAGCVIGRDYPAPVVEHDWARKLTLERYGKAKKG